MIAASLIAAVAGVVVLAPSVLAIFGGSALSTWPNIFISTAVIVVLLVIAVAGIRLTARTQVAMGVIEYVILIGFSIWGLVFAPATTTAASRSPGTGSTSAGSADRAAWPRACSSRCSCWPAGTPRSMSTRR